MDRLEKELGSERLIKVNVLTRVGMELAGQYRVRGVPTLVVVNGEGHEIHRQVGRLDRVSALAELGMDSQQVLREER